MQMILWSGVVKGELLTPRGRGIDNATCEMGGISSICIFRPKSFPMILNYYNFNYSFVYAASMFFRNTAARNNHQYSYGA